MEQKRIDITSAEIARDVHVLVNTDYFQAILRGLQDAVAEHGFQFVKDESGEQAACESFSKETMVSMARTVNQYRLIWLSPKIVDDEILCGYLDRDADEGYDHTWLMGLFNALSKRGIMLASASNSEL